MTLQNHLGERAYPVRPRIWHQRNYQQLRKEQRPARAQGRSLLTFAIAILAAAVVSVNWHAIAAALPFTPDATFAPVLTAALAFVVVAFAVSSLDSWGPWRDQRRYRRLTGASEITPAQQSLLALDAESDFRSGLWNSSLEFSPAWSKLPESLRKKYADGAKGYPIISLPMNDLRDLQADLDKRTRIASERDLELYVADGMAQHSMSARFQAILNGPDAERMLTRIAGLTGLSEWDLRALAEPQAGRPPLLLWAGDVQRLIAIVRTAFVAGQVSEQTAWTLIERLGNVAFALYTDAADYWRGVRIATAFASDEVAALQAFDETMKELRDSGWPATSAAFPTLPVDTLPGQIRTPEVLLPREEAN
ncbi:MULTISPECIES: DUF1266 domain-containing protein [Mycetocola]|uniref:DUF1266 domain-containing protein n=1 Tax=Mycetocola TaxID=76634 RepID=UPI00068B03E1|nr:MULTISPECIES: DUF1266 domain-containing protein [Mycetocola]